MTDKGILVVEDDPFVGRATVKALNRAGLVSKWMRTLFAARSWLVAARPKALLLDLQLPDGSGEELIPYVRKVAPCCRILAVSGYLDGVRACALLRQGIPSVSKPVDASIVVEVLRTGEITRASDQFHAVWPAIPETSTAVRITPREQAVVERVLRGAANKEIAQELGCSVKAIEFHVSNLLRKTQACSRAELVVRMIDRNRPPLLRPLEK